MSSIGERITRDLMLFREELHIGDPDSSGSAATVCEEEGIFLGSFFAWAGGGLGWGKGDEKF